LEFVGVGRRCGNKIFRRFDSIDWCSRFFFSGDLKKKCFCFFYWFFSLINFTLFLIVDVIGDVLWSTSDSEPYKIDS
jgi:hypothetical protein